MSDYCLIHIREDRSRVSTDFILQDARGAFTRKNNWTFDILSESIFKVIFGQIMGREKVKKCYIVLPRKGDFADEGIMQIHKGIIGGFQIERNVDVEYITNIDDLLQGSNTLSSDTIGKVVGL